MRIRALVARKCELQKNSEQLAELNCLLLADICFLKGPARMVKNDVEREKNRSAYKTVLTFLVCIVLVLSIARVVLSNILAASGQRLAAANQKIRIMTEENQKLENEASSLDSLVRIEKLANEAGFVKTTNVEVLIPSKPIASR